MADSELLRLVESIHRDKNIDREVLFQGIESALLTAARKKFGVSEELRVTIDRETGEIKAFDGDEPISPGRLGRIAAQTAKQVIFQRIREAESDVVFEEYEQRKSTVVSGAVARIEGGAVIVNLTHAEGILPYGEQMPTEHYRPGDRLRALVLDVRRSGSRVKIILSRTHPQFVRELFRLEVPEINDGTIEVKALAREAGYRTKIAVASNDPKVDCTGACVGVRGSRIRSIVDELSGEKIDVIRWSDSADVLLRSCLKPAEVSRLVLDSGLALTLAVVPQDQLSLAIGRRGQNVRLASRLTGWDIEIVTPEEAARTEQAIVAELGSIEGVDERQARALLGAGCLSARSVMLLSDEEFRLVPAVEAHQPETIRQWIEESLPQGADHLPVYQEVLAQLEAEAGVLEPSSEEPAEGAPPGEEAATEEAADVGGPETEAPPVAEAPPAERGGASEEAQGPAGSAEARPLVGEAETVAAQAGGGVGSVEASGPSDEGEGAPAEQDGQPGADQPSEEPDEGVPEGGEVAEEQPERVVEPEPDERAPEG